MAQKKITDLTLRSDFDASCNVPVDDSSQTWRATGQQIADFIASRTTIPSPTIQKFTSGSGTYTTPDGVKWIRVRMVGGGGGGAIATTSTNAAANSPGADAGDGGNTTFGTTLLVANGGEGALSPKGDGTGSTGGVGGSASLGTGPIGIALDGGQGQGNGLPFVAAGGFAGGQGASTPFGGGGAAGGWNASGLDAAANTGAGGGGAGLYAAGAGDNGFTGSGGGAGGYVDAIIDNPDATYAYAVGAAGAGGSPIAGASTGGDGGSGIIIVEEHYI